MLYYNLIKEKFNKITEMKYFDELFTMSIALITLLGWIFNSIVGMSILIIIASLVMLLTNDMKYAIPSILFFIFCINEGFANDKIPISIIVVASIFVLILLIQILKNKISISKMKTCIGLLGLAIVNIIPIFWANNIPKENSIFYIFFFANLGYLLLYIILINGIKKESFSLLCIAMTYLGLIIFFECLYKVIVIYTTIENILRLEYYLGWGVCNEAAIIICMCLPFVFYRMSISSNTKFIALSHFQILLLVIGAFLTASRAGIIFACFETLVLFLTIYRMSSYKNIYRKITNKYLMIYFILFLLFMEPTLNCMFKVLNKIFELGFNGNGRVELWKEAFEIWTMNPRNIILGAGITSCLRITNTPLGEQFGMIVFHSTIMETLIVGGVVAFIFLVIHFIEKYFMIYKTKNKLLFVTMLIGFITVDLYGIIDNTYHMYYYMIPLVIILSCLNNLNDNKESVFCE